MKVTVETDWLYNNLYNKKIIIIDFSWYLKSLNRNCYREYKVEHIPGAQFIDLNNISNQKSKLPHMMPDLNQFQTFMRTCGINNDSIVIIYDTFGIWSSPRLWWMLKYYGLKKVYVLNGGLLKWKKENKILTNKIKIYRFGNYNAKINNKYIKDKYEVLKILNKKNHKIIDARHQNRFLGKKNEPRKTLRKGNIPGSINIYWKKIINENGILKENKQLNNILYKLRISKNNNIITTCGSGVSACIINLALYKVNYKNISLYDGSWAEWGNNSNLPIK